MPAHTCRFSASWPDFCLTQGKNHKKQNGAKFIFRMLVLLPPLLPQHHVKHHHQSESEGKSYGANI